MQQHRSIKTECRYRQEIVLQSLQEVLIWATKHFSTYIAWYWRSALKTGNWQESFYCPCIAPWFAVELVILYYCETRIGAPEWRFFKRTYDKKETKFASRGGQKKNRQKMCSVVVVLTWATCSPQVGRVSIPTVFIDKQKNDNVAGSENVVDGPLERILAAWRVIHCYSKIPRIRHDLQRKKKEETTPNNFLLLFTTTPSIFTVLPLAIRANNSHTKRCFSRPPLPPSSLLCLSHTHSLSL